MKTAFVRLVWLVSALLLVPGRALATSSAGHVNAQHGHLLPDGKIADALLAKDAEHLTVTITAKSGKNHPPDWPGFKVSASCWPGQQRLGGFSFDMVLVNTNTVHGKRASAVFAFKGEPSAIQQISDVIVADSPQRDPVCHFALPLSREEVLARFRARASREELRELQRLRLSRDLGSQERAWELVLFKLRPSELHRIGVQQQIEVSERGELHDAHWFVAGGQFGGGIPEAVDAVLMRARINWGSSGRCGQIGWWVPKEQFFRARRALLEAQDPRARACAVPPPQFSFE